MTEVDQLFQQVMDLLTRRNEPGVFAQIREIVEGSGLDAIRGVVPSSAAVVAGTGKGVPADVPWIAVFHEGVKPSVQTGIYLAYLFAADGSRVYLSLNQGTEKAKTSEIKARAQRMRTLLGPHPGLVKDLDLGRTRGRPQKYTHGNAYAIVYETGNLPSHDQMVRDLKRMRALLELLPRTVQELDVALTNSLTASRHWLFQANPQLYDVMGAATHLGKITWTVNQHSNRVRAGDIAYIWESGQTAGVIAVGKVLCDPAQMTSLEDERSYIRDPRFARSGSTPRVRIGIERILPNRITLEQLRQHPVLSRISILRQPRGTVFRVTPEEARALDTLIGGYQESGKVVRITVPLSRWQTYRQQGYISIGWREVGDLRQYNSPEEIAEALREHLGEGYPTERQREGVARQLWLFRTLHPGDEVIATQGVSTIVALGRVEEPGYTWDGEDDGRGHCVSVSWDESAARRMGMQLHWRGSVVEEADSELVELARTPGPDLPEPVLDLEAVCQQFALALHDSHIRFGPRHDEVVTAFIVSLATKPFVILTGLSGSGKTQLAVRFGEWLGPGRSLVVAVRPDWTGPEALFGYEDALQEPDQLGRRAWYVPEALAFMLKAARDPEHPYLLVLDEMNLAHVERYFADVLSGMESEQPILPNLVAGEDGRWRLDLDGPERIPIPENLFVVGTVNVDETTYMFSPKVLDRANTLEFRVDSDDLFEGMRRPAPIEPGDPGLVRGFLAIATDPDGHLDQSVVELSRFTGYLRRLHRLLAGSHAQFGHRVVYEANRFAALLCAAGVTDLLVALDLQVLQKVLPRVHGSRKRIEPVLRALGHFCFDPDALDQEGGVEVSGFDPENPPPGEPKLPRAFLKVQRMMRSLRADQFVSFAE